MAVRLHQMGEEPAPLRWSNARYLALVESGVIAEGRGIELVDGQVIDQMPQGKLHYLVCRALQRFFESLGGTQSGFSTQPTIVVAEGEIYDPEFVLLRPEYAEDDLPRAEDVLWVIEVSVSSRLLDLGPKKTAYAAAKIPEYWVFDGIKRGVWIFTEPFGETYRQERFLPVGEQAPVPLNGETLDTANVFPAL